MRSTEKLIQALKENGAPESLIRRAENEEFNDYKSDSATPIVDLVTALRKHNLTALSQRAMDGEFDGTKEEAEEWFKKEGRNLLP